MTISIVIPTYNRAPILKNALKALIAQTYKGTYEVIVVNDGGNAEAKAVVAELSKITTVPLHYFHQENKGPGVARNTGVSHAKGDIILFIGDDIYLQPDALEIHAHYHRSHPQEHIGILGFVTWAPHLVVTPLMSFMERGRALFGRFGGSQFAYDLIEGKTEADYRFFYTAQISLKKSLLEKTPFDPTFQGYGWEDIDLGLRLTQEHGFKLLYARESVGFHDHEMTLESFKKRMIAVGKGAHTMQQKYPTHNFVPQGFKKTVFDFLSAPLVTGLLRATWSDAYWYALSKKYFLEGLAAGYTSER